MTARASCYLLVYQITGYNLLSQEEGFRNRVVERYLESVVLLILESLGSTELLFILAMALVFFGPRKLPQISRSLGKNLAEFRRASEDFKRTWDREVSLEEAGIVGDSPSERNSIAETPKTDQPLAAPSIAAIAPDDIIARHSIGSDSLANSSELEKPVAAPAHSPKNDWL